jgi:hypothetical protein
VELIEMKAQAEDYDSVDVGFDVDVEEWFQLRNNAFTLLTKDKYSKTSARFPADVY